VGSDIGLTRPTNLEDGLRWGILLLPVLLEALGGFFCFVFFWKHFFGRNFLGGRLPSFCLPLLLVFLVDCCMVHFPSFALFA
jgi:hypothetical protein